MLLKETLSIVVIYHLPLSRRSASRELHRTRLYQRQPEGKKQGESPNTFNQRQPTNQHTQPGHDMKYSTLTDSNSHTKDIHYHLNGGGAVRRINPNIFKPQRQHGSQYNTDQHNEK
jgi:hypothetical protein